MKQPLAPILAALLLLGCRSSGQTADPFFGRTTVPPPGTGSVYGPSEPYYQAPNLNPPAAGPLRPIPVQPSGPVPVPPQGMPPASTTQYTAPIDNPVGPLYNAAGGWRTINANVPGSYDVQAAGYDAPYAGPPGMVPVVVVPPARPAPPSYAPPPTYPVNGPPAGSPAAFGENPGPAATWGTRPLIVRTLEPRPRSDAPPFPGVPYNPSATPAGRDLAASRNTIPPPDDGGPASIQRGLEPAPVEIRRVPAEPPDGSQVVVATATETLGRGPRQTVTTPRDYYAHDPDYRWLRGRLEYSQVEGHWRLRYIPMAGAMDDFGGSVIIANPAVLAGLERGEWVEVRGHPGHADRTGRSYAPEYEVVDVKRLVK